jgi:hypothetical protein
MNVQLTLRDGTPVELVGDNKDLLRQVERNALFRKLYQRVNLASPDANLIHCASLLLVLVSIENVPCYVDSAALEVLILDSDVRQKPALQEAACLRRYVVLNPRDRMNDARLARANELIWLVATGNLPPTKRAHHMHGEVGPATWNTSEPTMGLGEYSDL